MKFHVPSILTHFPYYCSNVVRQSYDNNEMSERVIVRNHFSICTVRAVSPFGLCKVLLSVTKGAFYVQRDAAVQIMQRDDFVDCKCKI